MPKVFPTMNKVLYLSLCLGLLSACGPGPVANNNNNTNSVNVNISESFISDAVKKALEKEKNNTNSSGASTVNPAPPESPPVAPEADITDDVEQELQAAPADDRQAFSIIVASATAINNRDYESFQDVFHPDFPWGNSSAGLTFAGIQADNLYQQLGRLQVIDRSQTDLNIYVERLVSNNFGLVYELTTYHMKQASGSWKIFDVTIHQQVPA